MLLFCFSIQIQKNFIIHNKCIFRCVFCVYVDGGDGGGVLGIFK